MENNIAWIILIIGIIALIYGIYLLNKMPSEIIKKMENECKEQLKKSNEEYEKNKKFNYVFKKWLFK